MTDDEIRHVVLEFFYNCHQDRANLAHSSAYAVTRISLPRNNIISAIQFLTDERYLKKEKGDVYRITSKGIARFSPSEFRAKPYSPVIINQSGGVSIVGNQGHIGTINNATYNAHQEINKLVELIGKSKTDNENKMQLIAEAEVLKAELTKPIKDKSAIKKAWDKLSSGTKALNDSKEIITALGTIGTLLANAL